MELAASAAVPRADGGGESPCPRRPARLALVLGALFASLATPASAASSNVRITGLVDLAFNTITDLASDTSQEEDVCVFSSSSTNGYRVTATGSGSSGAFALSAGGNRLAYEVQWNSQAGQLTGTQLTSGTPLTGLVSSASQQTCNSGPSASASLIVILRASALSAAVPGTYTGQLNLLIAPE